MVKLVAAGRMRQNGTCVRWTDDNRYDMKSIGAVPKGSERSVSTIERLTMASQSTKARPIDRDTCFCNITCWIHHLPAHQSIVFLRLRSVTMMQAAALRRALAYSRRTLNARAFYASPVSADALDMVDTFARRHSK